MKEDKRRKNSVSEYERNKKKIAEYRRRSNSRLTKLLSNLMEWINENILKEE